MEARQPGESTNTEATPSTRKGAAGDALFSLFLGLVFYLVFAPVALIARLFNRDRLARRFNQVAESYRSTSRQASRESLGETHR